MQFQRSLTFLTRRNVSSSQRNLLKRKNENLPSSRTPLKQQRVSHNIQAEHSYCSAADKIHRKEPSSVSTTSETPDLQFTPNVNDSGALKKAYFLPQKKSTTD